MPKAIQKSHLAENLGVFDFDLSEAHMEELNALDEQYSSLGSLPYV